jgi:hypothetical protein
MMVLVGNVMKKNNGEGGGRGWGFRAIKTS